MRSSFTGFRHSPVARLLAVVLIGLAWDSPAFCGAIHDAAKRGDLQSVVELLEGNPDLVNSKDTWSTTPLHYAAENGRKDMVEFLLAHGADVNATNVFGQRPLMMAEYGKYKDVAAVLLANNAKDQHGNTPLHLAVGDRNKDAVASLLARNADVNAKDDMGETPLRWAVNGSQRDLVELLLAGKADINARDKWGQTPLDATVAMAGESEYFSHNLFGARKVQVPPEGEKDAVDMMKLLLAHKADYSIYDAAALGDLEKVKSLLKDHPDLVFSTNLYGNTPLQVAAEFGHRDVAELLLANKADPNARGNEGATPLHWAAAAGWKDVTELLLAAKAGVNATNNYGWTSLQFAEDQGHADVAQLLRLHGGTNDLKPPPHPRPGGPLP